MDLTVNLKGTHVLVTGGSAGIGRAIALEFARNGATVAVHYFRTHEGAEQTVQQIHDLGGNAFMVKADVAVKADVDGMIREVDKRFTGKLDVLVNNAGDLIERCPIAMMSEETWDRVIDVNLKSVFLVSQAVLPMMKAQKKGRIINISSIAGQDGGGLGAAHYSAAKGGVIVLTKGMAKEFATLGITVNAIAPGLIATRYHERYSTPENRQRMLNNIPLSREGTVDDIAGAVLFLASDAASYITGETLKVNGGMRV
jgi:3-oxoacyl-[acyl-carrier protein] reductase